MSTTLFVEISGDYSQVAELGLLIIDKGGKILKSKVFYGSGLCPELTNALNLVCRLNPPTEKCISQHTLRQKLRVYIKHYNICKCWMENFKLGKRL